MADRYWVGGNGTWNASSTTNWSTTSGGASGASAPTSADNVFFDANSGGSPFTVTLSAATCADLNISSANFQVSGGNINVYGSTSCSSAFSTSNLFITMLAPSGTVTVDLRIPVNSLSLNGGSSTVFNLGFYDLTQTTNIQLLSGTMESFNGTIWYCQTFSSPGGATRAIGSSTFLQITAAFRADAFVASGVAFSCDGAIAISDNNNTFAGGGFTYGSLFINDGSGTLTITGNNFFRSFTGNNSGGGIIKFTSGSTNTFGSFYIFGQSGLQTTINATTLGSPATLVFWQKPFGLDYLSIGDITASPSGLLYAGASSTNLGGNTGINFSAWVPTDFYWIGGTGVWNSANQFTLPNFNSWSNTSGGSVYANPGPQDNVIFNAGSDAGSPFTVSVDFSPDVNNFTISGLDRSMTFSVISVLSMTVRGNWTTSSSNLTWDNTGTITFAWRSGVNSINTGGLQLLNPLVFDATSGSWSLSAPLETTGAVTLTRGTLALNTYLLDCSTFSTSNTNTRTLNFGTGSITLFGTGTVFNAATITNLTVTGTPFIVLAGVGASARTVSIGSTPAWAQILTIWVLSGSSSVTLPSTLGTVLFDNAFTGSWTISTATLYGSLTLSSAMTLPASTATFTVAGSGVVQTINTNGRTLPNITLSVKPSSGGSVSLQSAINGGSSSTLAVSAGTFLSNNYAITMGTISITGATTRTVDLGSSTVSVSGSGTTAWNATTVTGLTFTQTGTINMNSGSAKTFVGGGLTYGTLNQGFSGALTISGTNTFTNITNTQGSVGAATITFAADQTVANFTATGTVGKVLTIQSSVAGTRRTLTKTGGGTVSVDYMSIRDSGAAGATWYAGANSTNVSNNTGWIFTAPAPPSTGNFLMVF